MRVYKSLILLAITASAVLGLSLYSGICTAETAISTMQNILSGEKKVEAEPEKVVAEPLMPEKPAPEPEKPVTANTGCGPEEVTAVEVCEIGTVPLCIDTPQLSVAADQVIIRGTVDRRTSLFSHMRAYVQHEYTKKFNEIKLEKISSEDCTADSWAALNDACVDQKGRFAVKIPLGDLGPYTIMIDAVGMNSEAVSKTVRVSKVTAVNISRENITLDPDPSAGNFSERSLHLKVGLLKDCSFCDLIGTSTGGVMITVTNTIKSGGGEKTIVRRSNISKGGAYDICVPVLSGENSLSVEACNAAVDGSCPKVADINFNASVGDKLIDIISPEQASSIFSSDQYAELPLKFKIPGYAHDGGQCKDGDVVVTWNRNAPVSLCPDASGYYNAQLMPDVGINYGTIEAKEGDVKFSRSFVLGWGRPVNPYTADQGWVKNAASLSLGETYINDTIRPLINNFLNSKKLPEFIASFVDDSKNEVQSTKYEVRSDELNAIKQQIPFCTAASTTTDSGELKIELVGKPQLKKGELEKLEFTDSSVGFKMNLEDLRIHLRLKKYDTAGKLKKEFPLLIAFKFARLDGKINANRDKEIYLITSDNDNCDYQSGSYCEKKPALLIPQNLLGGAAAGGAWVSCDDKYQKVSGDINCADIDILNMQTGLLNEKVLDMVNDMAYCQGSAYLTQMIRNGMSDFTKSFVFKDKTIAVGGSFNAKGGVAINKNGLKIGVGGRFGGDKVLPEMDPAASKGSVLMAPFQAGTVNGNMQSDNMSLSLSSDIINELLYQLVFQKEGSGLLDWTIDKPFLDKMGFDYVKECDAFNPIISNQDAPPVLCQLLPRVGEVLGASLTTYGYYNPKQPLQMVIKGSRKLSPHVRIYREMVAHEKADLDASGNIQYESREEDILELQIPDVEIAFYAVAVDEAAGKDEEGNYPLMTDGEGSPIVQSLIVKVKATFIIAVEVSPVKTSDDDPTQLVLNLRPEPALTRVIYENIDGGNATIVPDESLISALASKINYGINEYGKEGEGINCKIPKTIKFISDKGIIGAEGAGCTFPKTISSDGLFEKFGIGKMELDENSLSVKLDYGTSHIEIIASPKFE